MFSGKQFKPFRSAIRRILPLIVLLIHFQSQSDLFHIAEALNPPDIFSHRRKNRKANTKTNQQEEKTQAAAAESPNRPESGPLRVRRTRHGHHDLLFLFRRKLKQRTRALLHLKIS
ncbi:hypothetical protein SDC9_188898 [bioreactor metagenome]|uniref:Uncharacterized protein n=1 Tax=bioreactor metagenome TaxID=1076179 RepID=A0A645I1H0_9ZZZZ